MTGGLFFACVVFGITFLIASAVSCCGCAACCCFKGGRATGVNVGMPAAVATPAGAVYQKNGMPLPRLLRLC